MDTLTGTVAIVTGAALYSHYLSSGVCLAERCRSKIQGAYTMSRTFFRQISRSLDNVVDKTPDAQTAFIPFQALFFYVIGIVCFVSGPKYVIGGLVCFGIASLGMLLFVSLIRERFFFIYLGGECIGVAFSVMAIIFFIQHGFSSVTLLFAAFAFWYLTFGTLGIFLTEESEKNWWLLGIAHSVLVPGMNFIGVWPSPSYYWLTLPFVFVTIGLTVAFIPLCVFQHQSKARGNHTHDLQIP